MTWNLKNIVKKSIGVGKTSTWGVEDIDIEGFDPTSKLPEYIPPRRGKAKVPKNIDERKVTLHTSLLPNKIAFEGTHLAYVPHLKLEDFDLADMEHFPHLATDKFMHRVFYKDTGVTALELRKWIKWVDKEGLLNILWVPHYNRIPITMIMIKQLLCLVHDGCLWLEEPIPITDMLIHKITQLLHLGLNPAMAFGGKTGECDLTEKIKDKFKLVKKLCGYSISIITDPIVKVDTQILVGKIMRKCRIDEVRTLDVSLAAQCTEGIQLNWARYLCSEFLVNCREMHD